MCSTKFVIALDEPDEGVYRGGRKVTGVVKYKLNSNTTFKYMQLTLTGKSKCNNFSDVIDIEFDEKHVSQTLNLLGKNENVLPGTYHHQFQFCLPVDIPPTFKLDIDVKIKYNVGLKVKHACFFRCIRTVEREIIVYGNYGIALRTLPTRGQVYTIEKKIFKLSSGEHPIIKVLVHVDKCFVTPGEFINMRFIVRNFTGTVIKGIRTKIVRKTTIKSEYCLVHEIFSKAYKQYSVDTVGISSDCQTEFAVAIQALPHYYSIPKTRDRQAIVVDYFLKVTVMLQPPHKNESTYIPIVVGVKPGNEDLGVINFVDFEDIEVMENLNLMKRARDFLGIKDCV